MTKKNDDIYTFIKAGLESAGIKLSFGYHFTVDLKNLELKKSTYAKIKFIDKSLFDVGVSIAANQEIGLLVGVKLKKHIKLDLGVCTQLQDALNLKDVKLRPTMGIRFEF